MRLQKIPLRNTRAFTDSFLHYQEQHPALAPFYGRYPAPENFRDQIKDKSASFGTSTRQLLSDTLLKQYASLKPAHEAVQQNILSLRDTKTFTVTTGHQLNIFTGPLYFIYKIVTVIKACQRLKAEYPDAHFVPVYWMASEDHDYEEIKSFRLYGKKYTWETQQQGAVGPFEISAIRKLLTQLPGDISVFEKAYTKNNNLADAVRDYVNALFGVHGLVVVDANDAGLKKLLAPVMRADLFEHLPYHRVLETNEKFTSATGHAAPVNPREINFFYLDQQMRNRIEQQGEVFKVVDTKIQFSRMELESLIDSSPEKFSPNVILRPLYQEMILPNLAYVGGPAELVYWLELKAVFQHFQVPYPMLMPRNFAMVVDKPVARKMGKTELSIEQFFEEKNFLHNHWVLKHSEHDLSVGSGMRMVHALMTELHHRSTDIDASLGAMVKAEGTRMQAALTRIEQKMVRAEKRRHDDKLRQISEVKDVLFPNGGLQERVDNFLNFYQQDPLFIDQLLTHFDPFDYQFHVLTYE
jgi:bacillithiol biosynthesis cysteine-adding enzyme BshC